MATNISPSAYAEPDKTAGNHPLEDKRTLPRTDRQDKASWEAQETLELARTLVEHAGDAVFWVEPSGRIFFANKSACSSLGYSREELRQLKLQDLNQGYNMIPWPAYWRSLRQAGFLKFDTRHRRKNGTFLPVGITAYHVTVGSRDFAVALAQSTLSNAPAHTLVSEEKHLFDILMENVPDHIYFKDRQSRFIRISTAQAQFLGLADPSQAIGKTDFDFFTETHARQAYEDEQQILRTGQPMLGKAEKEISHNGRERWVATAKLPLTDPAGQIIGTFGISRNITKSKLAEEALRASEQFNKRILESTSDGVCVLDLQGGLLYMSVGGRRLLELNESDDITHFNWLTLWEGADEQHHRKAISDAIHGGIGACQGNLRTRNGLPKSWDLVISPITGENGEVERLVCVFRDITERRLLESQLAQAQKLESIGQLAAGIAHEINTPIQYIGDNGKFLEEAFRDLLRTIDGAAGDAIPGDTADFNYFREEIPRAITQLLEGVQHVGNIVRAMKDFSHPGLLDKSLVDINRAIESTIVVSRTEWKYVAELTTDLDPALPRVPCLPGEFNQVILNLIVNAAHAIADLVAGSGRKGSIHISTRWNRDWVEIRVSDTGSGIPEAIQSKVFDPFFTTKPVGKGTGQGLAIAHAVIVRKHRGKISFESASGVGTTFLIQLPLGSETGEV